METDPYRRLFVGLAMQRPPADPTVAVDALRDAVEEVVLPATFVELDWRTTVVTPQDDLEAPDLSRLTTTARGWDRLRAAAAVLESGSVGGRRQDLPRDALPPDPSASPVSATARLLPGRPATLAWSVQRWAVRDWPAFCADAARWLVATGDRLGADSGFVTHDVLDAVQPQSAFEIVTGLSPADRDFARLLWGYGWGTLLSGALAGRVGGAEALRDVPGAELLAGPGGQLWVRLGDDPATVDRRAVAALREVLTPVLPAGRRTVADYLTGPKGPFEVRPSYVV